jgi:hypothetical protein
VVLNVALIILACIQRLVEFRHTHTSTDTTQDSRTPLDDVHLISPKNSFHAWTSAQRADHQLPPRLSVESTPRFDEKNLKAKAYESSLVRDNGLGSRETSMAGIQNMQGALVHDRYQVVKALRTSQVPTILIVPPRATTTCARVIA